MKTTMGILLIAVVILFAAGHPALATEGAWNTNYGLNSAANLSPSGYYNTYIGNYAGWANTSGDSNTGVGYGACDDINTGYSNVCVGNASGGGDDKRILERIDRRQRRVRNPGRKQQYLYGYFGRPVDPRE